jgi:glutaredoxin 2
MIHLASCLEKFSELEYLNMSYNPLGAEGMRHLASGLVKLVKLRHLNLCDTQITPGGIEHLASCLEKLSKLESLNLSHNHIRPREMILLEPCLRTLVNLRDLNLYNSISEVDGIRHLKSCIEKGGLQQLQDLSLSEQHLVDIDNLQAYLVEVGGLITVLPSLVKFQPSNFILNNEIILNAIVRHPNSRLLLNNANLTYNPRVLDFISRL